VRMERAACHGEPCGDVSCKYRSTIAYGTKEQREDCCCFGGWGLGLGCYQLDPDSAEAFFGLFKKDPDACFRASNPTFGYGYKKQMAKFAKVLSGKTKVDRYGFPIEEATQYPPSEDYSIANGWISPEGVFYRCGYMEHNKAIKVIAGIEIADDSWAKKETNALLRKGWLCLHWKAEKVIVDCLSEPRKGTKVHQIIEEIKKTREVKIYPLEC
jgi:hypothetical protein